MTNPRDTKRSHDRDQTGSLTTDLAARIARARAEHPAQAAADSMREREMSGLGRAYRMAAEFVAAILVGLALGWGIDQLFGTTPWAMVILLLLGFAAGVVNVVRASAELNAAAAKLPVPPSVPDDDDE